MRGKRGAVLIALALILAATTVAVLASSGGTRSVRVTSAFWETGQTGARPDVPANGRFAYCEGEPLGPTEAHISYVDAPVGGHWTLSVTTTHGLRVRDLHGSQEFVRSTGEITHEINVPWSPVLPVAKGTVRLTVKVGGSTLSSFTLTLIPRRCARSG